jgi:hypothetical protein
MIAICTKYQHFGLAKIEKKTMDHSDRKSVGGAIVGSVPSTGFDMCLISAAMKNIIHNNIEENFVFVAGGNKYKCSRINAEFLSSRVLLSHSVDPSIAEYC